MSMPLFPEDIELTVTIDVAAGAFRFEWMRKGTTELLAKGRLQPPESPYWWELIWTFESPLGETSHGCTAHTTSARALVNRIRKVFPVADESLRIGLLTDTDLGMAKANRWLPLQMPPGVNAWKWLEREVYGFAKHIKSSVNPGTGQTAGGAYSLHFLACNLLDVKPSLKPVRWAAGLLDLRLSLNQVRFIAEFTWSDTSGQIIATGRVRGARGNQLKWETEKDGQKESVISSQQRNSIRTGLNSWLKEFPTNASTFTAFWIKPDANLKESNPEQEPPLEPGVNLYSWIEENIVLMAEAFHYSSLSAGSVFDDGGGIVYGDFESYGRRLQRKEQKRAEEEARRLANMERLAEQRRLRDLQRAKERKEAARKKSISAQANPTKANTPPPLKDQQPLPPLSVRIAMPQLAFQETAFPASSLQNFFLRERAALWWVSNQSDDLLCLPHCQVERLDYQVRAALRVLGPLRGRALLSDEVGLGKTIEAGLVIKELLTRGMARKFLILTTPSLVDQWEEELASRFNLETVTTNHAARNDPARFWNEHPGIVASLHTLKQPAQLEIARQVKWDILIVDEAHYLRNRESQAWQAVNVLPRQFLLLLTATPVQNSLEELYNLVALLQPGQLPAPKEFRSRFIDPKRPRQPREPEELRRLLGQVMIRNTRANAGLKLPPRRAETVMFEPDESEREFWEKWEREFREALSLLNPSQAKLWGRLLLQTAGSSPAAWQAALDKFPNSAAAARWKTESPLDASWHRKCELIPPLTRNEGGAVIFTQFLETQSALAEFLRRARIETFVVNGSTPAAERQPITEDFRKRGGALLLTRSGTEGRNLQFSRNLVNFDLPWNPMEIEQRIGRLHRLGQQHPVRIYNFVQKGTLQEHLLQILQEKLNLFELVVGETGLVLGERFGSDEFAEEVFRRWQENEGRVAEAMAGLGEELANARDNYQEIKQLDETLFSKNYESL